MASSDISIRLDAAGSLYKQYRRVVSRSGYSPDVREQLEHSLTLVLNEGREADSLDHLLRNVQRDARRILRRRAASRPVHEEFDAHEGTVTGSCPDPEQLLIAKERYLTLMAVASDLGADGASALDGLMADEPIEDTARRCGVAMRRVRYMRTLLRVRVSERIRAEEAA